MKAALPLPSKIEALHSTSLLHAQIMLALLFVEALGGIAQHRARHGGGMFIQKAPKFLESFSALLPNDVPLIVR